MLRSKLMVPAVTAVCLFASQALLPVAYAAAPFAAGTPGHAFIGAKMVKMHVTNESTAPLKIQAGDQPITIEPGKSVDLNLAIGTRIVNIEATPTHAAGEVLVQVSGSLSGATLKVS